MEKLIWFDARNVANKQEILPLIYNFNFEYLLVNREDYQLLNPPRKMNLIVEILNGQALVGIDPNTVVVGTDLKLLQKAREEGYRTALYVVITNQEEMNYAWQEGVKNDFLIIELKDETNIPLELLIARLQDKGTKLLKKVTTCKEMQTVFGVMEVGSDGVLFASEDIEEILKVNNFMEQSERGKLDLVKATVTNVESIGMGSRACIDTTDLLRADEGMLIGSTSCGGLLVSSETHYLPYMNLRPFRVNAGAVHSYVWAPEGMTEYLSELKAGTKLLAVATSGRTRTVSVGRVKIEKRPLLKIEAEANGLRLNVIVQDDWHIRIFGGDGEVRNASTIKAGEKLLAYVCPGGRHVGIKINEQIEEK